MKLKNEIRNVEIEISVDLVNQIGLIGTDHYPNEFGGFLIGYYSDDNKTLLITDIILPNKCEGLPFSFLRSSEGIEKTLKELYDQEPKKYYVGEWHTHPNGATMYSQTDLKAMISIEKCSTVKIHNPVLLILSISENGLSGFDFYLYENKKLSKYGK